MIESPSESDHVRRHDQFVLLVPAAADELVRLDAPEGGQVEEGELRGQVVGGDPQGVQHHRVQAQRRTRVARQRQGLVMARDGPKHKSFLSARLVPFVGRKKRRQGTADALVPTFRRNYLLTGW